MNIKTYKKSDGKTYYEFSIRVNNKTTRRRGFKSKEEAKRAYFKLSDELEKNSHIDNRITYQKVYDKWIEIYKSTVTESTLQKTLTDFNNHILPYFGKYPISKIKPYICQEYVNSLKHYINGKSIFNQAKRVYEFAVKMNIADKNPFNNVILPKFKEKKVITDFLTVNEVKILLDYIESDLYWYCAFRLLIYTGLRRGELLALEWNDIDFKNNELNVNKTLTRGIDYQLYISNGKTKKSVRKIILDKDTVLSLKKLKLNSNNKIIFPNKKGKYRRLGDIADMLNKIIKNTGIKRIRVHDLRHTHASLLFASGATAKEVQERLGHTDIKTTMNIYTHVTEDKRKEAVDKFVNYLTVAK